MPTYGYRCDNCGHQFEILQRITAEPLKTCPKCQGKLAKMLYPAGVIFKGSGYYTTDYKGSNGWSNGSASSNGSAASDGSAPSSGGGSESKPETKSESKPEAKSEAKSDSKTEKTS
ncbi:hypothetical protein EPN29_04080 [bacterium]|nr:MAG: hypothetical protein EPN29_04080 [bacterium]